MNRTEQTVFNFQNLEITRDALVLHFYEDKTVIPLNAVVLFDLTWHLHQPIFGKKWWYLVLTVVLKSGGEESGPVAATKFNYVDTGHEVRRHIEDKIGRAIYEALAKNHPVAAEAERAKTGSEVAIARNGDV